VPSVAVGSVLEVIESGCAVPETANETAADLLTAGLDESLTAKVMGKLPAAVGVPEIRPVLAASATPAGNLPDEIDHVYGAVPSVAVSALEYFTPSVPDGKEVVVIESAFSWITNVVTRVLVRAGLDESLTAIVMPKLPPTVGIPVMVPVLAAKLSPVGSFPALTDQVYGVLPPVAVKAFV
jgi:hypothetical protein